MDKTIEPNRVYNVKEVAELLGVAPQTIVEYCRNGQIISQKIGEWKILGQSLLNFMGIAKLVKELTPILNDHIRVLNYHEVKIKELEAKVHQAFEMIDSLNKERLPKQK